MSTNTMNTTVAKLQEKQAQLDKLMTASHETNSKKLYDAMNASQKAVSISPCYAVTCSMYSVNSVKLYI